MGKRRRARELALQFLFQLDINPPVKGAVDIEDSRSHRMDESDDSKWADKKASEVLERTEENPEIPTTKDLKINDTMNRDLPEKPGAEDGGDIDPQIERAIDLFKENFKTDETAIPFFLFLVRGVCKHKERIDKIINDTSENWKLDRMGVVDRNILRFAIFELMFADDIPSNVSMNEAIEIAKRYGTADSPSFINGILDKIASLEKSENKKRKSEADID